MRHQRLFPLVFSLAPLLAAAQSPIPPQIPSQIPSQLANPTLQQMPSDPCVGSATASPQLISSSAAQKQALEAALVRSNPGSGSGPIPDVFDWQPRGRAPAGTMITITGQGLQTTLSGRIGDDMLTKVSASPTQIRLRIPNSVRAVARELVVWQQGGRPRTLEPGFRVFDPDVSINKVHPNSFGRGQVVTLCGSSLFFTFQASPNASFPETRMLRVGDHYIEMHEAVFSPGGERATFRAGRVALRRLTTRYVEGTPFFEFHDPQPPPASVTGRVALTSLYTQLSTSQQHNTDVQGPIDSEWSATLPVQISKVQGRGVFNSVSPPFVLVEASGNNASMSRQILMDGLGLDGAALRIGDRNLGTVSTQLLGNFATANVDPGMPSGQVCAVKAGRTVCGPQVIRLSRAPVFSTIPAMPLAMHTVHTIVGLHLRPDPGISGLTYEFKFSGADVCAPLDIVEHSDSQIRFRLGNPDQAMPSSCASNNTLFGASASGRYVMAFSATYGGTTHDYLSRAYWLRLP